MKPADWLPKLRPTKAAGGPGGGWPERVVGASGFVPAGAGPSARQSRPFWPARFIGWQVIAAGGSAGWRAADAGPTSGTGLDQVNSRDGGRGWGGKGPAGTSWRSSPDRTAAA